MRTTLKITVEVTLDYDQNQTFYTVLGECTDCYGLPHITSSNNEIHTPTMIERNVVANVGNIIEKALSNG